MTSTKSVPASLRQQVDRWGPFNYPIAVFSEWRGKAFYLNVHYRARSGRPEDDFVVRHTRMTQATVIEWSNVSAVRARIVHRCD